jgi:hypothetical protein
LLPEWKENLVLAVSYYSSTSPLIFTRPIIQILKTVASASFFQDAIVCQIRH